MSGRNVTNELLAGFTGGQARIQSNGMLSGGADRRLYLGEIKSATVDGRHILVDLIWLAQLDVNDGSWDKMGPRTYTNLAEVWSISNDRSLFYCSSFETGETLILLSPSSESLIDTSKLGFFAPSQVG